MLYETFGGSVNSKGFIDLDSHIGVVISGETFEAPGLLVFRPGDRITVRSVQNARLMIFGGDALEGPRHIWWNFVSSRAERIEQAKEDWKAGRFKPVPGETEFIPLPDS